MKKYPYPKLVHIITGQFDAWIVGSGADPNVKNPRDWDVIVPYSQWQKAALLIPRNAKPTMFGGWKCTSSDKEVDIWPGELGNCFFYGKNAWAWQPRYNIRIRKEC